MIAVRKSPYGLIHAATTMISGKIGVKERLSIIIKTQKTIVSALVVVILITTVSVGCTFTGAKTEEFMSINKRIEEGLLDPNLLVRRAWEMIMQDIQSNEETSKDIFGDEGTTFIDAEM